MSTVTEVGKHNVLAQIMRERKRDVAEARRGVPLKALLWEAEKRRHHSLVDRLRAGQGCCVVAEVKKASPSAGLLRAGFDPAELARGYAQAGAAGISVLTEPLHFLGSEADLRAVRAEVDLPILRKDFMSDPYQLAEAAAWGADVILLIVAGLDPSVCLTLHRESVELGLEAIVEVHTREELDVALQCEGAIIGVNSRNLKTLKTDLAVARDLIEKIPEGRLCMAESGIRTGDDVRLLRAAGYDGFLIGESLLRQPDPGEALRSLMAASQ
ncbi:MAG: indole-3-glycerol phosphate synthase TrpC [bacterium]